MSKAELKRLEADRRREVNWKRWGPYLSERQWGTVREDYSADGDFWSHFPHEQARSRAYRWGEDGLLGICDRQCRLCFALALWNGEDAILKERLFGLSNPQGNHGEDVKEYYRYLAASPTYSYAHAMYRYPQQAFPYDTLVQASQQRGPAEAEYELADTGIFDDGRFWDIHAEYAKAGPNDVLIRLTVHNRGPEPATLTLVPTLWFRNTWTWGCRHEGCTLKPRIELGDGGRLIAEHETLGRFALDFSTWPRGDGVLPVESEGPSNELLFTDNHTNRAIFGGNNPTPRVKDAFHRYLVNGEMDAINPNGHGTKVGMCYRITVKPDGRAEVRLRLTEAKNDSDRGSADGADDAVSDKALGRAFASTIARRRREAEAYRESVLSDDLSEEDRRIAEEALAGLLWSKQFYHYIVPDWLAGDPNEPDPPAERRRGRNADWDHLFNRDVISMPDKWEFPWYATWDLGFQMVPIAQVDPDFAKQQCLLFLREWYMHPNGQLPAYEMDFNDTNPPVHAWACRRVFEIDAARRGEPDHDFLARCFQKLLLNFTWWVNRKDTAGRNIFSGGFLGLDNIGVMDRSRLPPGVRIEQADATAWMGFYCAHMLAIALELAQVDATYEDLASKFFEHFISLCDAINTLGGHGLWDDQLGLYRDELHLGDRQIPMPIRSIVGLLPIAAVEVIEQATIDRLPGFAKRMHWFLENRSDLARHVSYMRLSGEDKEAPEHVHRLLAIPSEERLRRVLTLMLDEDEFLSPFGVRSLSLHHRDEPFVLHTEGQEMCIGYEPGESTSRMFGGNSNWRGPVWMPINYLFIESLRKYHHFFGDQFTVPGPGRGSERKPVTLNQAADAIAARCRRLFMPDENGVRPCNLGLAHLADQPDWRDWIHYHEYFHADSGKGLGASHQTGWTALIASMLNPPPEPTAHVDHPT